MRIALTTLLVCWLSLASAQTTNVTIEWQYIHVIDGYDHQSKMIFHVDDMEVGESTVAPNSVKNEFVLSLTEGVHTIKAQNWALYEGNWEEVLEENDYSMDANYELSLNIVPKQTRRISIIFDVDSEKVITVSVE